MSLLGHCKSKRLPYVHHIDCSVLQNSLILLYRQRSPPTAKQLINLLSSRGGDSAWLSIAGGDILALLASVNVKNSVVGEGRTGPHQTAKTVYHVAFRSTSYGDRRSAGNFFVARWPELQVCIGRQICNLSPTSIFMMHSILTYAAQFQNRQNPGESTGLAVKTL